MDFSFAGQYMPLFFSGIKLTLIISVISIILATFIGIFVYVLKTSHMSIGKIYPFRMVAFSFIEIMRGTPVLLQVLVAYVIISMSPSSSELPSNMAALIASIAAISLNSSVYIAEIVRAGIQSVARGQMEAARSLGMTHFLAMREIVMPQAIKNILPAIGNEFIAVIKGSSMAYVLGVAELTFSAKVVQGATYKGLEPLLISAVFYLVLTFSLGRIIGWIERRLGASDLH
jgi:polar amino acid transport system permease protein/polar amino acid transport system substrate-binding protein